MKKCILFALTIAATLSLCVVGQAQVVIDNYFTEENGDTAGAYANYSQQSFVPSTAGLGTNDTVGANSPLPGAVSLQSVEYLRALQDDSPDDTSGGIFLDVYQGVGDLGTYVGSSTNSIDINSLDPLTVMTWNFTGLSLDSTLQYSLVFSFDDVAGNPAIGRTQVARDAAGAFVDTYPGGESSFPSDGSNPLPFEPRFQITMAPGVSILLGDVNLDGSVDFLDISPFISVLSSGNYQAEADIDGSTEVDFLDISPFIALLAG